MNLIFKSPQVCPECHSMDIIHDYEKIESYCGNCGIILINNDFITLSDISYLYKLEEKEKEAQKEKESINQNGESKK